MALKINELLANAKYSYGDKRDFDDIIAIVIHNTGNVGDTAQANAKYFSPEGSNTRFAGAHFFVDRKGIIYKSVNINRPAWSVGGCYSTKDGAGTYYKKITNDNSVSIELCDIVTKYPSLIQRKKTKKLIKYIKKKCPNIKYVVRHYDVNGKNCPSYFCRTDANNKRWTKLKKALGV